MMLQDSYMINFEWNDLIEESKIKKETLLVCKGKTDNGREIGENITII